MGILKIEPASRRGMKFLISLFGLSETGKTYSALKLAAGMEPNPAKRLLLDTEGGQRGRAYVDAIAGGYLYAQLTPPFTPERYIEALTEIEAAGVSVVVVDSVSHAWFAEGGILDMVENATEKNDMAKWKGPKRRLGKMTRRLMSADFHTILCSRAKQPLIKDGANYVPGPVVPIQEKTLRYDMTIMAQMLGDGAFSVDREFGGKCPGILRPIFAANAKMDESMGRKLIEWLGQEAMKTADQRQIDREAEAAAEAGSESFRAYWKRITGDQREYLRPRLDNFSSIAQAADTDAAEKAAQSDAEPDDPFPSVPAKPITIEQIGNAAPEAPILTPDELLQGMTARHTIGDLIAWRRMSSVSDAIAALELNDQAAWSTVIDAYEDRRQTLAEAA